MKKSKENEHRISNLKDMLNNVKDEDINESADNSEDVFDVKDNEEYEEDEELLAYLHDTDDNKEYTVTFVNKKKQPAVADCFVFI